MSPVRGGLTRRDTLLLGGALAAFALPGGRAAWAGMPEAGARHGLSVFGALKYPADFAHLDYVNPDAPKGGRIVMEAPNWQTNQNPQTYNTFNMWVLRGDSPPRLELIYDSLMVRALDEPDAVYGLVAESVAIDETERIYTFTLRPEARFHDGTPMTAADVVFTLTALKEKGHPLLRQPLRRVVSVTAEDERVVSVTFAPDATNRLPPFVAGLSVLPKHWYDTRDFEAATLEIPLGSGPYRVGNHRAGTFIEYERDPDWWGRDLPIARGFNNFHVIRIEFYRDRAISFQALSKGDITYREEFTSKTWATEYNFPAVQDGRVIRATLPDETPAGAQGWFINTRRAKFADPRTREALGFTFDFEWTNANLFHDLYERTDSYFENSEMKATGEPSPEELALLEPFRGQVPDSVFGPAIEAPVSDGSGQDRRLLRRASELLAEAGWRREGQQLVGPDGTPFTVEVLSNSPTFERVVQPWVRNMKLIGVDARFRLVDPAQYQLRLNDFDFDMTVRRYSLSPTPGESIREFWTSDSADVPGSNNLPGIADPAIDALTETLIHAPNREEMVIAARALDRVLRSGFYWVPNWYKPVHTVAYWDLFGRPQEKPRYGLPVETAWWWNAEKAARIGKS